MRSLGHVHCAWYLGRHTNLAIHAKRLLLLCYGARNIECISSHRNFYSITGEEALLDVLPAPLTIFFSFIRADLPTRSRI